MSGESLGAARLDIEVDLSQLEAAVKTAKSRVADMSSDAQKQYSQLNAAEKKRVDRLIAQADALSLTKAQQVAYNAALKTSGPVLDEITRKLALNEARMKASSTQFGLTIKQNAAAMRQVPAQLTDIFVGLASGQRPMMVLLQQGGQLKDVFGGVVPAARALGGALLGLINPVTILAATVGTLAIAYNDAEKEAFAFHKAIILSGNVAGVTSSQLEQMANDIDAVVGTRRRAAQVLAELATTGKVSAAGLRDAATAAIQLERVAGIPASETIKNLIALGERPTEASKNLTRQYGYLTAATYTQIKALEEQGRTAEAAELAQKTYIDAGRQRAGELEKHLSTLPRLARAAKDGFTEMWDAFVGSVRPDNTVEGMRRRIEQAKAAIANSGWLDDINGANTKRREIIVNLEARISQSDVDARQAEQSRRTADQLQAIEQWDRIALSNLSKKQRLEKEIVEIRQLGLRAGKSEVEIQQQIAAARAKDAGAPKVNPADALIKRLQEQVAVNREQLVVGDKLTASERLVVQMREELSLTTKKLTGEDRKRIESLIGEVAASGKAVDQMEREKKAREALAKQESELNDQVAQFLLSAEDDYSRFGRGQQSQEKFSRRIAIIRDYETRMKLIGERSVAEDKALWDQRAENAAEHRNYMLREEAEYQGQLARLRADPANGAVAAWDDYLASAKDVSAQTYTLFTDAFQGAEDALVKFALTGKLSFKDMANSIIADLARMAAKKAIMALFTGIMGPTPTPVPNARGGVYSSPSLSAFSNSIVSSPTLFRFARGAALGEMGEAGSEAILPLKRTQGGQLGVVATGAGGGVTVNVFGASGKPETKTRRDSRGNLEIDVIFREFEKGVADSVASGGLVSQAIRSRFTVQERV